ncbi:MAG: multicopper oxidase domain-containing protein [Terriglobales bacterium]
MTVTPALLFSSLLWAAPRNPGGSESCQDAAGSTIESPPQLVSRNGRLQVTLTLRNFLDSYGRMHYCYVDDSGDRSPTLRVQPGDLLLLKLQNKVSLSGQKHPRNVAQPDCKSGSMPGMAIDATNLHFHGLAVSPVCPADDSLHVSIAPSQSFLYRVQIPKDQPPGLYWYHPHPHGHTEEQVMGGASGALIVEGISQFNTVTAGLPERVFVIRDQKLRDWKSAAAKHAAATSKPAGQQTDPSRPSKDLSINFIPVPYPEYPVASIHTKPQTREFWRVLNASADTYVNLGVLFNGEWRDSGFAVEHGSWQQLGLVSLDGMPIQTSEASKNRVRWKDAVLIPPGGRAEFIFETPPEETTAELITEGVDTNPPDDEDNPRPPAGPGSPIRDEDDYTPPRPLARIVASHLTSEPPVSGAGQSASAMAPPAGHVLPPLATVQPVRQRTLYFSEKVMDARHPESSTIFMITEQGHTPKAFNPAVLTPNIVVHQGDVEDWIIENRSTESHAFHIHQLHFLPLQRDNEPVSESDLLDTIDVPYWDGISKEFPSVKLRMDFRSPNIVGIFPYHCHILQHADSGMMGLIEVRRKAARTGSSKIQSTSKPASSANPRAASK